MLHLRPHPELHPVFEALAYAAGYGLYKFLRSRAGDVIEEQQRWSVIAAAMLGALVGSRALGLLEQAPRMHITLAQAFLPGGGKTIVGGLLGGWIAVEVVKRFQHIHNRTGDLFALPLCVGIAVGRIGCLLAGLADDTYGKPSSLPWAVDFSDGLPRHPTQAYEIVFLLVLTLTLYLLSQRPHRIGTLFQVFMAAYLMWRLVIDFLKPQPVVGGLNMIQWACCGGLVATMVRAALNLKSKASTRVVEPRELVNRISR
jgi:prolipoprotein diacylglyceryltransferase